MDKQQILEELKTALSHLNDVALLADSPLVTLMGEPEQPSRGMDLRSQLLDLIERMKPSAQLPETSPEWRQYHIMHDRYVLRRPLWEIEHKLTIGERQVRREHSRGLAILTEMLQVRFAVPEGQTSEPATTPREAVQRLTPVERVFSLAQLAEDVVSFLVVAGKVHESQLRLNITPDDLTVSTDPGILRQLLINLLLSIGPNTPLSLDATMRNHTVEVVLALSTAVDAQSEGWVLSQLLARSLGAELALNSPTDNQVRFELLPGTRLRRVLVIDDEMAAVELFQSYVIGLDYRVIGETNPEEALARALEAHPDIIIIDVMMPGMDGWELLQRLRHTPPLRDVPVIVCSVLNEADLATTLGAAAFLKKPILRSQLVAALGEVISRAPGNVGAREQG
jgi:CheY-like chemotaxis protein